MCIRSTFAILLIFSGASWGAQPSVLILKAKAPNEFAEPIHSSLQAETIQVKTGESLLAEFWLRTDFPVAEGTTNQLEVQFNQVKIGTLVGGVRFLSTWSDYKGNNVEPGLYTLRFGIRPADGNHMGVSIYRDFVLLIPADQDKQLEMGWSNDDFTMQSFGTTGVGHPGVMSIAPIWVEISKPSIVKNDMDEWTLAIPFKHVTFGLVVEGRGEH